MKSPARTALRHAADATFHLRYAAKAAGEAEVKAQDAETRLRARAVREHAVALSKLARQLEQELTP